MNWDSVVVHPFIIEINNGIIQGAKYQNTKNINELDSLFFLLLKVQRVYSSFAWFFFHQHISCVSLSKIDAALDFVVFITE